MDETTKRPLATLEITWDPNTGNVGLKADEANQMELLGMMEMAAHALLSARKNTDGAPHLLVPDRRVFS